MGCYAVLVDGGFIRRKLGSAASPMTASGFEAFLTALGSHAALADHKLHRVYFYDAAPLEVAKPKPLCGGTVNFATSPTAVQGKALHAELVKIPFLALRMGELSFRGWNLGKHSLKNHASSASLTIMAEDLTPNIQQKGVDMRIGLDIAALTLKKLVDVIVLVTADSDFVPAMKFARREGAHLMLVHLGNALMQTMVEHSDVIIELPGYPPAHAM
jgi:uncharacterized protein (TIGR00288 family)